VLHSLHSREEKQNSLKLLQNRRNSSLFASACSLLKILFPFFFGGVQSPGKYGNVKVVYYFLIQRAT
jgi:hypothetical protein